MPLHTTLQGRAILYDAKHRPPHGDNGPPLGLPTIKPSARQTPYHFPYAAEGGQHLFAPFPGIPVRAASRREPRRYLQEPSFSNCTVPIAFWPHYDFNFVHNFRGAAPCC